MDPSQTFATLSENERIIRTYKCTSLRPWFKKPYIGYLSITNKRLVYHSVGKTNGSDNAIISEIPLEDVSGINTFIGNSFHLLLFIVASVLLFLASSLLREILPRFLTGWVLSIFLMLPYLIGLLFEKQIINEEIGKNILNNIKGTALHSQLSKKDSAFYMNIFKYLFVYGFSFFAWNLIFETFLFGQWRFLGFILLLGAYYLLYMLLIGHSRAFGLQVSSKTAGKAGILIRGTVGNKNNPIGKTINAEPAEDAENIARELGALILDIQQMGDLGIEKWTQRE